MEPAPAALGVPPREASASVLTSGLLTLPETTGAPPGPWSAISRAPSTPRVAITRNYPDQLGLGRDPRSLPPYGVPEPISGIRASRTRKFTRLQAPELFGRTSGLPLTTALPANSGNSYQRGSVPHGIKYGRLSGSSLLRYRCFGTVVLGCPFPSCRFGFPFA